MRTCPTGGPGSIDDGNSISLSDLPPTTQACNHCHGKTLRRPDTKTVESFSTKLNTSVVTRLPSLALRHWMEFREKEFTNALRNGQPSWRVSLEGPRVCNLSFGGPRGSISMFSRMTDACESDKGPPTKLTGLEYFNYHLSPLSGSAARLSETRTSG